MNDPMFWMEYGLIRQQELIEEARRDAWPLECPSPAQRLWQSATSRLEKVMWSLGLQWQLAYSPTCQLS